MELNNMKIKLDKDFSKAISEASKFAASSGSDIYKCLKIQGGDNVVTITAYNGSGAFYETKAKADVKESGLIALPASMIKNLTERFRGELIADEKVVEIKDARSKFELAPMKIDGFPTIPAIDETTATIVMDAKLFYEGIENVCYAAGEAEGHPENNSVKMSSEGGKLFFDALDGFRAIYSDIAGSI
jgi:DNA polymerase III sliding clamp (beta) subunit (PCNA family)